MPQKAPRASNKRAASDADVPAPRAKRATAAKDNAADQTTTTENPLNQDVSATAAPRTSFRLARGPNGEPIVPDIFPKECAKDLEKILVPPQWIRAVDATPNRSMTLNSRQWWENHGPWMEANKERLSLKAPQWKMKDEAVKQEVEVPEDEGYNDWDFVCVHEPSEDDGEDEDENEGEDEDEDEDQDEEDGEDDQGENDENGDKPPEEADEKVGKLASLHPDHAWVFSMLGQDRFHWWLFECLKRDQDQYMMHIYNDFTMLGNIEVLENIPRAFIDFGMIEDSDKAGAVIELIGCMVVAVLERLKEQDVLKPGPNIPNLGLVMALYIKWVWSYMSELDFTTQGAWIYRVIDLAKEANIPIAGPPGFETSYLNKIKASKKPTAAAMEKWTKVNLNDKCEAYRSKHGAITGPRAKPQLGGDHFDITKMSAAERKKASSD